MEVQEEEEGNVATTLPLEPRRHKLLSAPVREGETPAAAVSIRMNFEGSCENFLQSAPPPLEDTEQTGSHNIRVHTFYLILIHTIIEHTSLF